MHRHLHVVATPAPTAFGSATAPRALPDRGPARDHYPELDGHRALAVLGLTVFHVYQFCNVGHFLYFGTPAYTILNSLDALVPWLFVITALLLFAPVARAALDGRPMADPRFLARRAIRILPVYYVAVLVVWFARQRSLPGDWRDLLEHLTFTQIFDEQRIFYTIGPAWAVSVTVLFSIALFLLGVVLTRVCARLSTRRRRIAAITCVTATSALIAIAWKAWSFADAHRSTTGSFTTWFGLTANLDAFAVGMAIALILAAHGHRGLLGPKTRLALRTAGAGILCLAFATRQAGSWWGVAFGTLSALGFGCLVAAAVLGPPRDRVARVLSHRVLLWLSTISFGIYLWHEPILLALRGLGLVRQTPSAFVLDTLLVLIVSITIGRLSYSLIERPARQLAQVVGRGRGTRTGATGGRDRVVSASLAPEER